MSATSVTHPIQYPAAAPAAMSTPQTPSREKPPTAYAPVYKSTITPAGAAYDFAMKGFDGKRAEYAQSHPSAAGTPTHRHSPSGAASHSSVKKADSKYAAVTVYSSGSGGFQPVHPQTHQPAQQPNPSAAPTKAYTPLRVTVVSPVAASPIPVTAAVNLHQLVNDFVNCKSVDVRREWVSNNHNLFLQMVATLNLANKAEWLSYLPFDRLQEWALRNTDEFLDIVDTVPLNHRALRENPLHGLTLCEDFIRLGACQKPNVCKFAANFFAQIKYQLNRNPLYKTQACIHIRLQQCNDGCSYVHIGDLVRRVAITTSPAGTFYDFRGFLGIQTADGPLSMRPASEPRFHESAAAVSPHPHARSERATPAPSASPKKGGTHYAVPLSELLRMNPQLVAKSVLLRPGTASPASLYSAQSTGAASPNSAAVNAAALGAASTVMPLVTPHYSHMDPMMHQSPTPTAHLHTAQPQPGPASGSAAVASPSAGGQESASPLPAQSAPTPILSPSEDDDLGALLREATSLHLAEIDAVGEGNVPPPVAFTADAPPSAKAAATHAAGSSSSAGSVTHSDLKATAKPFTPKGTSAALPFE